MDSKIQIYFKQRRQKIITQLAPDEALLIFSLSPQFDRNLYYLTGITETPTILLLTKDRFIIFHEPNDTLHTAWYGERLDDKTLKNNYGVDAVYPLQNLTTLLHTQLQNYNVLYTNYQNQTTPLAADLQLTSYILKAPTPLLAPARLIKDDYELSLMRMAANISVAGHLRVQHYVTKRRYEYELAADLIYEFTRHNASLAFNSIVASGKNSCILHYEQNSAPLNPGELVVIDAAAQYQGYAADISRTLSLNGHYNRYQQAIYEAVLTAQTAVIAAIVPGVTFNQLQQIADHTLCSALIEHKILAEDLTAALEQKSFQPFTLHKIGHWLGLDVHDVGNYDDTVKLQPGMVLTVEPGLYLNARLLPTASPWANIGVRIEDDILVTATGHENLTAQAPKAALTIK